MEKSMLLEVIGDTIENRIIDMLIEGIVKPTRSIGRVQLYSINTENEKVKALFKLEEFLLKRSFEETKEKNKVRAN